MEHPRSDVASLEVELEKLEEDVLRVLEEKGPMKISEVAEELDCSHDTVREAMNNLSRKRLVASLPSFEYEYVGEQTQRKPA
ncbi:MULTISPECIES: GntR family transcriptional regulator [Halobacterium]|uniref:GntR family transcriptional regulator n=1 Tax=Halobacterium TaxID=2239 RepID=UPI00073F7077|nr:MULTISPECIES: GntR family transcriptional regulator [Halobacterium]MCG1001917.1 GntR family transcriptional regulator [Halobacterium noricense]